MGLHRADPDRPGAAFWFALAGLAVVATGCGVAVWWALHSLQLI